MIISDFDKQLQIEQVRYIEADQMLDCDIMEISSDLFGHGSFKDRLWKRAQYLVKHHKLTTLLNRGARLSRNVRNVALIMAALFGILGMQAVTVSHTINSFWLLLGLLVFNFISMLLWLTGVMLNMKEFIADWQDRLSSWLIGRAVVTL